MPVASATEQVLSLLSPEGETTECVALRAAFNVQQIRWLTPPAMDVTPSGLKWDKSTARRDFRNLDAVYQCISEQDRGRAKLRLSRVSVPGSAGAAPSQLSIS